VKDESFVALCCVNIHCPAIIKESLIHAVSKHCLDISGLGESLIVLLVDVGLLKNI
jgi:DNA ligase (NAD+)